MEAKKILIVDDEPQITRALRRGLSAHGYEVRVASDGQSAIDLFRDLHPDLVITDLVMPEMDGIAVCQGIRSESDVPIIILSVKGEERTKVRALDAGADDYVTKPFGMEELLARVRAALRRTTADNTAPTVKVGDFTINDAAHQIFQKDRELQLTPKEYDLLSYLIRQHDKVITHRTLLSAVWGGDYSEQTEYLRVFIANLRKKIEADPTKPKYIFTEPWVGYRFRAGD